MALTRGEKTSQNLENELVRLYTRYGGKHVEGHGILVNLETPVSAKIPKNTAVVFLAEPGKCMWVHAGRSLAHGYFRNENSLIRFFKGEAGRAGIKHGEILSRTFFEGSMYPNMRVTFYDKNFPGFGFVRRLPLRRNLPQNANNMNKEHLPERGEIFNRVRHGPNSTYYLSQILTLLGPGVYIINACMPPPDWREHAMPINAANVNTYNQTRPRTGPVTKGLKRLRSTFPRGARSARPGTLRKTHVPSISRVRSPQPRETVQSVLRSIAKNPRSPKTEQFNKLPINANIEKLKRVKHLMSHPRLLNTFISGLPRVSQMRWYVTPRSMRPAFIHKRLKNVDV